MIFVHKFVTFIIPRVIPLTIYLCKKASHRTVGTIVRVAAAVMGPQRVTNCSTNKLHPTGKVVAFQRENVKAIKNSLQHNKKVNNEVTAIAGLDIGKTILISASIRVQPSIMADSSTSGGISLKNPCKNHIAKGRVNVMYVREMPAWVSIRFI